MLLDLDDIDASAPRWLRLTSHVVQVQSQRSARLAAEYLARIRRIETGAEFTPIVALPSAEQIATSLTVTGPVHAKRLAARALLYPQIRRLVFVASSGSAMRLALAGGRQTIAETVSADDRATGWARTGSGHSCAFCSMLISRGPVYKADTVRFEAHDNCSCSGRPVYSGSAFDGWTPQARSMQAQWRQAKQQATEEGVDTFDVFRRLVEAA